MRHYVCAEVRGARKKGVPVAGVCLYPVLDYPGWENERTCAVGLLSSPNRAGRRAVCTALARELHRQTQIAGQAAVQRARRQAALRLPAE